eukprot:GHVQ01037439.1.p1 GENE.GHVQ01037439.1~~GHVQ01037439.1.p1  ORF type:complete len:142 (+),score=23.78 GHVQ01037439.1:59-427(+)
MSTRTTQSPLSPPAVQPSPCHHQLPTPSNPSKTPPVPSPPAPAPIQRRYSIVAGIDPLAASMAAAAYAECEAKIREETEEAMEEERQGSIRAFGGYRRHHTYTKQGGDPGIDAEKRNHEWKS